MQERAYRLRCTAAMGMRNPERLPKMYAFLAIIEESPGWHRGGILLTSSGFVYILLKNNLHSAMGAVLKTYCLPLFQAASMAHSCSY